MSVVEPTDTSEHQVDSQGDTDGDSICLKCRRSIAHIPYNYEGNTFHARCLVCNFCGKKLVGKPFITEDQFIYCGDMCKQSLEEGVPVEMNLSPLSEESTDGSNLHASPSESLIEALDSINETSQDDGKLAHPAVHIHIQDPDQITDYPRSASPRPAFSQTSLDGSVRSSLSAVSECSVDSEGSHSYDANRRPTKNILKNPHRPRRRIRKNVRWNLQPGVSENDSDTTSLESFDSTSTSNSLFLKARNGVDETRRQWREFERAPPPGSTGITPMKPNRFSSRPSSAPRSFQGSPTRLTPLLEPTTEQTLTTSSRHSVTQKNSRFTRSPSPLTSTPTNMSHTHCESNRPSELIQSTPIRRLSSDTTALKSRQQSDFTDKGGKNITSDDILILKLNDSKVSELEASTLEDRQRMHIFKFPTKQRQYSEPAKSLQSSFQPLTASVRTAFLEEDDESDYDHLAPLPTNSGNNLKSEVKGNALIANMVAFRNKKIDKKNRSSIISYTEDDIDDALKAIDENGSGTSSDMSQETPGNDETPPPLPAKHNRGALWKDTSPVPCTSSREEKLGVVLSPSELDPIKNHDPRQDLETTKEKDSPLRKPPPVPPKLNRIIRGDRSSRGNPKYAVGEVLPPRSPSDFSSHLQSGNSPKSRTEENILPPPPEFATSSFDYHQKNDSDKPTKSGTYEDVLGSASTSTLVAEQDLPPADNSNKNSSDKHELSLMPNFPPQTTQKELPWSKSYLTDRIVVGAEDPLPSRDSMHRIHKSQQSMGMTQGAGYKYLSGTASRQTERIHASKRPPYLEDSNNKPPHSPRYTNRMESAFGEEKILSNSVFASQSHPDHNRAPHNVMGQDSKKHPPQRIQRSTGVPHRPAPPPPPAQSKKEQPRSGADQLTRQFLTTGNQQTSKPDLSIQELLSELNIKDNSQRQQPYRVCAVCSKAIQSPREHITFNNLSHHSKCFFCTKCRSFLQSKKPHYYHNRLYCWECYVTHNATFSNPKPNSYKDYHRTPTTSGGQITTV